MREGAWEEIGGEVEIRMLSDDRDRFVGIEWRHPGCGPSADLIAFDKPWVREDEALSGRLLWDVQGWDPLTLSPSLLCMACGTHGFVRDGRWVDAGSVGR